MTDPPSNSRTANTARPLQNSILALRGNFRAPSGVYALITSLLALLTAVLPETTDLSWNC